MIAVSDLRLIPLLAGVSETELAKLADSAGDVRLGAGEYAAHEGIHAPSSSF